MCYTSYMLTTQQVAEILGVKRVTVVKWIKLGYLPAVKFGRDWQIDPADVASFVKPRMGRKPNVRT